MPTIEKFEDLEIWQLARKLYNKVSVLAERLRKNKEFRFADQIKSAAGSSMDNIAEGFSRGSRLEFVNSLTISKGETGEVRSQTYRLLDDNYVSQIEYQELQELTDKLSRKIANFVKYLNESRIRGPKFKNRKP